jgi:hypothetical protein
MTGTRFHIRNFVTHGNNKTGKQGKDYQCQSRIDEEGDSDVGDQPDNHQAAQKVGHRLKRITRKRHGPIHSKIR